MSFSIKTKLRAIRALALASASLWSIDGLAQNYGSVGTGATPSVPVQGWARIVARSTRNIVADLYVDGRVACRLPCQPVVPAGVHRFEGRGADGASTPQSLYVAPGTIVPLLFDVLPSRATISVTALDPGTLVFFDDVYVSKGSWQGFATPGPHRLLLRRVGGEVLQQTISVAPGMNYAIRDTSSSQPNPAVPATGQPSNSSYPARPSTTGPQPNPTVPATGQPSNSTYPSGPSTTGPQPNDFGSPNTTYRGITGAAFAPIILGGPSTNSYNSHCPATEFGGSCSTGGPRGGALALQLGYSYGWIAPEAMLALSLDVSSGTLQLPPDLQIAGDVNGILSQIAGSTKFMRLGILGGLGARVSTQSQGHRFTFSGVFGLVKRHIYVLPDSFFGSKPSYTGKTLFFDAGVMLGDSPGVKIYAGLFLWLEFVPSFTFVRDVTKLGLEPKFVPQSLQTITPFSGTQIMFGPMIGATFGH